MRAMVVDDARVIRMVLGRMLRELGMEVFEAAHGLDALSVLKAKGNLDLALVDWNMPEMNGLEFVKAVRADNKYRHMRLVMVTTETEISRISDALEAGANEYIMKPFTKEVIAEKLELIGIQRA